MKTYIFSSCRAPNVYDYSIEDLWTGSRVADTDLWTGSRVADTEIRGRWPEPAPFKKKSENP